MFKRMAMEAKRVGWSKAMLVHLWMFWMIGPGRFEYGLLSMRSDTDGTPGRRGYDAPPSEWYVGVRDLWEGLGSQVEVEPAKVQDLR